MALSNVADSNTLNQVELSRESYLNASHLNRHAVCWSAIFAGAAAAAALSLILLLLGAGLGLSSVSPWANKGVSAGTFGISTIVWITVTQILASGMGGYLAGRLRTKWVGVHTDEVYFRDTANGFLAWAVASLVTAALLASAIGAIVNGGVQAAATVAGGAATAAVSISMGDQNSESTNGSANSADNQLRYFIDALFRSDPNVTSIEDNSNTKDSTKQSDVNQEVVRIFINSMGDKTLPANDVTYIGQLISKNTGLSQQEAESRVNTIYTNLQKKISDAEMVAKIAAEKARKATIYATLWLFVSLLMGAFSASLAATWGGRNRDIDFINQPHSY